jgi:hypothetical protein
MGKPNGPIVGTEGILENGEFPKIAVHIQRGDFFVWELRK